MIDFFGLVTMSFKKLSNNKTNFINRYKTLKKTSKCKDKWFETSQTKQMPFC